MTANRIDTWVCSLRSTRIQARTRDPEANDNQIASPINHPEIGFSCTAKLPPPARNQSDQKTSAGIPRRASQRRQEKQKDQLRRGPLASFQQELSGIKGRADYSPYDQIDLEASSEHRFHCRFPHSESQGSSPMDIAFKPKVMTR
ncbi:hypothetical protein [Brevundimonas sp. TWP2-3-4b2]|uniref:hypothetical protein n=1 Tax=Brevundimonas sp. TWP2-3-4b2 TaxID=2804595 RepID=UPI003CEFF9D8